MVRRKIVCYIVAIVLGVVVLGLTMTSYSYHDYYSSVVGGLFTNMATVNSTLITYSARSVTSDNGEGDEKLFTWSMSTEKMKRMLSLLNVFLRQIEKQNVTYLPCCGTLLGIDRHHGQIPWDDDVDIMVSTDQKKKLIEAVKELSPKYSLLSYKGGITGKWKFYKKDDYTIPGKSFRYPYIDIFFMRNLSEEEMFIELYPDAIFRKNDIYPLIRRSFNGVPIYTPCNMSSVLNSSVSQNYTDACMSAYFNHSQEVSIPRYVEVKCDMLKKKFPFVKREFTKTLNETFVKEDLVENGRIMQTIRYSLPNKCDKDLSYYPSDLELNVFYNR